MKAEVLKKEKLLSLNYKKKFERQLKELRKNQDIEFKHKLKNAKEEVEKEKIELARLKSLENIRLKKFKERKKMLNA